MCVPPLNYEATEGENVTISFKTAGLERADQVKITLTRGSQKKLIAQYCRCVHRGDCSVRETSGVLLRAEEGTVTLLHVSSNNSGLYEVIIIGSNVSRINATLVVNEPLLSSSNEPPQSSITNPPDSSERQRLYALIAPVVFILVVLGGLFRLYIFRRKCKSSADVEAVC